MTLASPRVTVFMPVHNRERFVSDSIASVLAQSYSDFELLVIDDGSSDRSAEVIESIGDPRIRLVRQESNRGIPKTRNHGLELARGEYIALLDSDDHAYPQRLARQVAYLDSHPDVAAVGSWAHRVTREGKRRSPATRPYAPRSIAARILYVSCFKNPTIMARTDVMREFRYREEFVFCQDIDLWARISTKYALANLPEFLIRYTLGGDSHQNDSLSADLKMRVAADQLRRLGLDPSPEDLRRHHQLRNLRGFRPDADYIDWCEQWLVGLLAMNAKNPCHPEPEFARATAERWMRLAVAAGPAALPRFLSVKPLRASLPGVMGDVARLGWRHLLASLSARPG